MAPREGLGRSDGEKESKREENTPSFVASCSLHFCPRATNCCLSRPAEAARGGEAGGVGGGGGGGVIGHNKQYILPRLHPPPRSPHSSVFHSALSGPDGSDRLPSKLQFLADPAADHLFPFLLHHLASFVYDTLRILSLRGFWRRREYRAESQFQRGKK